MGDDHKTAIAKSDLGYHLTLTGEYDEAGEYLRAARDVTDDIGDDFRYANVLKYLGLRARKLGAYEEASRYYEEAIETARQIDNDGVVAEVRLGMADLAYRRGADETAREWCLDALGYFREQDAQSEIATGLRILALVTSRMDNDDLTETGKETDPLDCLREAREIYQAVESDHGGARVQYATGVVARRNQDYDRAREALEAALDTFERLDLTHDAGRARHELGLVALAVGDEQRADTILKAALDDVLSVGAPVDAVRTLETVSDRWDPGRLRDLCDATLACTTDRAMPKIEAEVASLRRRIEGE
jgi:tetratricopeptide (TPR) repeat protein